MTPVTDQIDVAFNGSAEEQRLAAELFRVMQAMGRFMAADAPIRVSFASVQEFFQKQGTDGAIDHLERVLTLNAEVFAIEERNGERFVVTTRAGRAPRERVIDASHSFGQRFMTPLPKPEAAERPVRERPRIDPSWSHLDRVLRSIEFVESEIEAAVAAPSAPAVVPPAAEEAAKPALAEEEVTAEPAAAARTITVPAVQPTDVTGVDDLELANAVAERLRADPRIANFGDQWMMEDAVPRFSRGDLRRMREYIQEQEQPLTDDVLVQDVLAVRPGSPNFDLMRFAVNYRLSKEHREFDFVGTNNQRFWSISSLPPIGTTRRKPNEIGSDFRFLLDELPAEPVYRSRHSVDHVLTFYEYYLGLIPYDAEMQALLPAPLLPNQRSAVLTFETPQTYTTYLVELRYPTPNRGGFILGLDDFFAENLVPGALITIKRTENDGHYIVEFLPAGNQSERLLELDDRRQRYVFRPTTFSCAVEDAFLLTEERFPRLANEKPLDEKIRRRPEAVVAATFERIGQPMEGPGYWASFTDLLAAVNIERPFSARFLRSILDNDETGAFARDPDGNDAYTYVPGTTS